MAVSEIKKTRLKKLARLKKSGIDPYPVQSRKTHSVEDALADFDKLCQLKTKATLLGRITAVREHGGSAFIHFEDGTGKIQAYFKKDKLEKKYRFFLDYFDVGDFIEITGALFATKKGEKTVEVSDFRMLAKSLLPLPEKWHGLQDVEERFRKRYLDLLMNPEVRKKFRLRSKIIAELRHILNGRGFLEVETPILQPIPGGALAKPFKTHLNALKMDLYLRISPELYLKRLLVGGFEKIYEIGRCFRNEGMDKHHNPDFSMLELYWAYQDRDGLMDFVESFVSDLVQRIKGSQQFSYEGKKIDCAPPWKRVGFKDIDFEKDKAKIIQPTFVVDHPVEMAILAKARKDNPGQAHRFQLVVAGIEMMNGFSELNDPVEQEKRFKEAKIETERKDKDFLQALQYGMPPAAGLGMGLDRLAVLLTDSHALREAILFPTMRPKK